MKWIFVSQGHCPFVPILRSPSTGSSNRRAKGFVAILKISPRRTVQETFTVGVVHVAQYVSMLGQIRFRRPFSNVLLSFGRRYQPLERSFNALSGNSVRQKEGLERIVIVRE
jgi:hypothetical protein